MTLDMHQTDTLQADAPENDPLHPGTPENDARTGTDTAGTDPADAPIDRQ